jgi:two-component system cell cycle sensor histidine kinase/response regulator CckA
MKNAEHSEPLRVLMVEHDDADAELALVELRRAGFQVHADVAPTRESFRAKLSSVRYDVVLADYRLPNWTGMDALADIQLLGIDLPLILVTGTLGEERAVECIKLGVADYVIKANLARLPVAVGRAIDEKRSREERIQSEGRIRDAYRALAESEARFRKLTEASFDAIDVAKDGVIQEVNDGFLRMFGYTRGEVLGRPITDFCAPESVADVNQRVTLGIDGTYELVGLRKDGRKILLEATGKAHEIDGEPARITALRDVTERRQLEDQFRQAQKMEAVGQLAGGVAHDFNNILTAIICTADLELMEDGLSPSLRTSLDTIMGSARRGAAITRQLLAFGRKQVNQPKTLIINDVVNGLLPMLNRLIVENIHIETRLLAHGSILVDPSQLEQIILNLVVNARDAMGDSGTVTIETRDEVVVSPGRAVDATLAAGRYCVLIVRDSGPGIDAATQARMFEPFFTTKDAGRGTGLGLSTVYGIVKQAGGSIIVESRLGEGTAFFVYLPRQAGRPSPASGVTAISDLHGTEVVLVVEDEAAVRAPICQAFRLLGYRVLEARNGIDALAVLEKEHHAPVHLVVSDVMMPGMNGVDLVARLRTWYPRLKALFISGYHDPVTPSQGLPVDGTDSLAKPFTPSEVVARARRLLDG